MPWLTIYRTTNGGLTWELVRQICFYSTGSKKAASISLSQEIISTHKGDLLKSPYNGDKWQKLDVLFIKK